MKVNHVETKANENIFVAEGIVIKQLLILAVVTLSLAVSAFLFSGNSGSSGSDGSSRSKIEDTSGDIGDDLSDSSMGDLTDSTTYQWHDDAENDLSNATMITLNKDSIAVEGAGAMSEGSVVTITSAGIYLISGSLDDGQIIVNADDAEVVKLIRGPYPMKIVF